MTAYFSYVGKFEAAGPKVYWDQPYPEHWQGNLPERLFPPVPFSLDISVFWMMKEIERGAYDGKQLDWGAWGIKLTGTEIRDFLGPDHRYAADAELLDADRTYIVVVAEDISLGDWTGGYDYEPEPAPPISSPPASQATGWWNRLRQAIMRMKAKPSTRPTNKAGH